MSGIDQSTYLANAVACLAFFVMGVRLLRLGLRSGEAPERRLGAAFLFWGLSYVLYYPPSLALAEGTLQSICFFLAEVASDAGTIYLALVIRCVFRSRESWASWLVGAIAVSLIAGLGGSYWVGDLERISALNNLWFWLSLAGDATTMVWIAIEGLQNYRKACQRRRLGLCEPLVCNRYLLWGLTGAVWILYDFAILAEYIDYEITEQWSTPLDVLVSSLDVFAAGIIWFVFFPPAFYRRWIRGSGPAATGSEG